MRTNYRAVTCLLALSLSAIPTSQAANDAKQPKKPPLTEVKLQEHRKLFEVGKSAFYRGQADEVGVAFYIKGLSINTPVAMVLEASDPNSPMTLQLMNDYSPNWDRTVSTEDQGAVTTRFRTEGPAVALVKSSGGMQPYRLAVWVGPEVKVFASAPPPFLTEEEYRKRHGGFSRWYLLGGVVLVLAIATFIWMRKRKPASESPER
jgi:hypothetical protein